MLMSTSAARRDTLGRWATAVWCYLSNPATPAIQLVISTSGCSPAWVQIAVESFQFFLAAGLHLQHTSSLHLRNFRYFQQQCHHSSHSKRYRHHREEKRVLWEQQSPTDATWDLQGGPITSLRYRQTSQDHHPERMRSEDGCWIKGRRNHSNRRLASLILLIAQSCALCHTSLLLLVLELQEVDINY